MKKFGFTLAEVLLTLGIIGVVSAVTLPTVMMDSKYKQLGVKLSKFYTTLENSASAYVAINDDFSSQDDVVKFFNKSYIFKATYDKNGTETSDNKIVYYTDEGKLWQSHALPAAYAVLKDGTKMTLDFYTHTINKSLDDVEKQGSPMFTVAFDPDIKGLPQNATNIFTFVVTTKGSIVFSNADYCVYELYRNNWKVEKDWFKDEGVCTEKHWKDYT